MLTQRLILVLTLIGLLSTIVLADYPQPIKEVIASPRLRYVVAQWFEQILTAEQQYKAYVVCNNLGSWERLRRAYTTVKDAQIKSVLEERLNKLEAELLKQGFAAYHETGVVRLIGNGSE